MGSTTFVVHCLPFWVGVHVGLGMDLFGDFKRQETNVVTAGFGCLSALFSVVPLNTDSLCCLGRHFRETYDQPK